HPYPIGWVAIPVALGITAVFLFRRLRFGGGMSRQEMRWSEALFDPASRATAVAEIDRVLRREVRNRGGQVRLTILKAELLDAMGQHNEADSMLSRLDGTDREDWERALVRHARAGLALRSGDAERARKVLDAPSSGIAAVDLRVELLRAEIGIELDEAEEAMAIATRIRKAATADPALGVEARVVRASALDALGDREGALEIFRDLDKGLLGQFAQRGSPRVRSLAADADETLAGPA
ncbi:MAG: hypothetical protein AAGF12_43675, partial [Myxococcota bacterium]